MKTNHLLLTIFILLLYNLQNHVHKCHALDPPHPNSPYYLHLPDCTTGNYSRIFKKTKWKGIVCPMIKDEVGFLAEWTAFYEMMGFDHVIYFDNNSTTSFTELEPWISTGFVEIIGSNLWWEHDKSLKHSLAKNNPKKRFFDMMRIKYLSEVYCKRKAQELDYDIFVSLDLDEYLFPTLNTVTVMDELQEWFIETKRRVMPIPKYNFNPVPHFLEPINLLVIEAFLLRMKERDKMNFYKSISPKVALWLSRREDNQEFTNQTVEYIIHCCDFHGCGNYGQYKPCGNVLKDGKLPFFACKSTFLIISFWGHHKERWKLEGKHLKWKDTPHIHHYARSFEKFMLKQRSWDTASGENSRGYDFYNFLDRTVGHTYDDSAMAWGCQLRELLRNRTGEQHFIRSGDLWYRNPEFGKTVADPNKRGRNGAGFGKYLAESEMNPYPPGDTYQKAHRPYETKSHFR